MVTDPVEELHHYIEAGDLTGVKRLVKHSSLTIQMVLFADSNTPLHTAADWGQDAVLRSDISVQYISAL